MPEKILLIEDDQAFQLMLCEALDQYGYEVVPVSTAEDGISLLKNKPFDLVLSDVMLPGMSGIEALPKLLKACPGVEVIVMTAFATKKVGLEAIGLGAYDYFTKPFSLAEMEVVIRRALDKRKLQKEVGELRQSLKNYGPTRRIIGQSQAMQELVGLVEKIAPLDTTVLVTGESGTGKELVSDVLHELSGRSAAPLVKINCAAIPDNLIESELFGHEKGAFTGALKSRPGKFELARNGTVMLDEIGEMPMSLQPKLLRVIEQKQVERVGGDKVIDVDVRIIAATNRDLRSCVADKTFREDLFYRLNVAGVHIPPLRERLEDIPFLAEHFLDKVNARLGTEFSGFTGEALEKLMDFEWPGNVRELANVVERAAILGRGQILDGEAVGPAMRRDMHLSQPVGGGQTISLSDTLREMEKKLIVNALVRAGGRQTEAASALGISPRNLWNKLQKHALDAKQYAQDDS